MAAPSPFKTSRPNRPRLAKKLRKLLKKIERKAPDLVPVVLLKRGVVVMDLADCGFLNRAGRY